MPSEAGRIPEPCDGHSSLLSHGVLSPSPVPRGFPQLRGSPQLWEGHSTELPSQMVRGLFFSLKHLKYEKNPKEKRNISCLGNPLVFLPAPATWLPELANKSKRPAARSLFTLASFHPE